MTSPRPDPAPLSETEIDALESWVQLPLARRLLATVRALQQQNERLRAALTDIVDPIAAMQAQADATDSYLNGGMAVILSNDPHFLKEKARAALQEPLNAD